MRTICATMIVLALTTALCANELPPPPLWPDINGLDFNFAYSSVTYDAANGLITGSGMSAAVIFEPTLGGTVYVMTNLADEIGASLSFGALFDGTGVSFDVDGFFAPDPFFLPDLVIRGKIPDLGIDAEVPYTGNLLEANVIQLELFGDEGDGSFAFNGTFRVTGGDLVTAGYVNVDDVVGMRSWLSGVSPSLGEGYDFSTDFTATTHLGEIGTVPEPASLSLLALAGILGGVLRERRARR